MNKFYDTSALLTKEEFPQEEIIYLSSITLEELEKIKSVHQNEDIRYSARRILRELNMADNRFKIIWFRQEYLKLIKKDFNFENNDIKILASALHLKKSLTDLVLVTNDVVMKLAALHYFDKEKILAEIPKPDNYCGYIDAIMTEGEMANFYSNPDLNTYNLLINQYLNIYNENGECVDNYIWTGETHEQVKFKTIKTKWFGDIKPMPGDVQQKLAIDSLHRNKLNLIHGKAGSGKSWLALTYLVSLLEKGAIDRIVIFCNPVATKDSARLGFYPGDRTTKLMDSQIGNFLISKFGGRDAVQKMIDEEVLMLLPTADIRGFDTTGLHCGVYITEAQNLNINLMKLAMQRIGKDSICVVEGDENAQVDMSVYEGNQNGMRRLSQVFRGESVYGEVRLNTIHRSEIGLIADRM